MPVILSEAVTQLAKNSKASTTKRRYNNCNVHLFQYLYKHHHEVFKHDFANELDQIKSGPLNEKQKERQFRSKILEWLNEMSRDKPENCPLIIESVQYTHIANYIAQKRAKDQSYLAQSSYQGIRSAVVHLFKCADSPLPGNFNDDMEELLKGMKRTIIAEKVRSGESMEEGKELMSFECYELLCKKFVAGIGNECIFAHAFLALEWNLMARSQNIVDIALSDMEWDGDCLICRMKKTKNDQDGKWKKYPFHLFCNPNKPWLCCPTAIGTYILSAQNVIAGSGGKLFPSQNQYNRYSKILQKVIKNNKEEFAEIGVTAKEIGSHSARKGAATYASAGTTCCPSMAAICNRAGWKMGGSRDKYIHSADASDQYLGRVLAGLPVMEIELSYTCYFFDSNSLEEKAAVLKWIKDAIPNSLNLGLLQWECIRNCIAGVIYHRDKLLDMWNEKHVLRQHSLVVDLPMVR